MNTTEAIYKLYPQTVRTVGDEAFDADGNEVAYDKEAVQAYVDSQAYIAKRQAEYPPVGEQMDIIFHQGLEVWKAQIQAVKDKYPKAT